MTVLLQSLILLSIIVISPVYATVDMYSVQLHCPIDSFDFSGIAVEFDALEMCEVSGTILNPSTVTNVYSGSGSSQIVLQIQENTEEPQPSLRDQLDNAFDTRRADLIAELQSFLQKNYSLKNKLADVEQELSQLIKILREKILLLKTQINQGSSNVNIDDIITESDLDKIARDFLSKQSIQFAYGDMFVFQDKLDELIQLAKEKTYVELQNSLLEQKISDGEQLKSTLIKEQIGIDGKLEKFKDTLEKKVEKIKENADKVVKGIKDLFK